MRYRRNFAAGSGNRRGVALVLLYGVIVSMTIGVAAMFERSFTESRAAERAREVIEADYLAEAGVDHVVRGLYNAFEAHFVAQGRQQSAFAWFDDLPNAAKYVLPAAQAFGSGSYSVAITNVDGSAAGRRDITLTSTAQVNGISKSATTVVRYALMPSDVFNHSYFINNFGWYWGSTITSNGDVRSNANFSFMNNPKVNGDVFAAENNELGATGEISGVNKYDSIGTYRSTASERARPSNPTAEPADINGDGIKETFGYEGGYDGMSERFEKQQPSDMPYLGDMQNYKDLAASKNGTIVQNGTVLVDKVLEGNVVLIGTAAQPIELNGPVVVTGDVIIKGVVKGQGTIYSGRNTHIVGNITYANPPKWVKPDTNPEATDAANLTKDFLGLAARGNVIVGNYTSTTWKNDVKNYLKPPFTQAYAIDPADAAIGYKDYVLNGKPYFDGNYLDKDGGLKSDGTARCFFESSFSDAIFTGYCDAALVTRIDAFCYTNHAFTGRIGATEINGGIASRDEAIVYSTKLTMNYDIRIKRELENNRFNLPQSLAQPAALLYQKN
ncbi:MAG: hypothetical protein NC924_05420 [Candidatus Omnitrophica bacterium]|nr:hypothetical protein [Candidatus Omnitrophota bacterium]